MTDRYIKLDDALAALETERDRVDGLFRQRDEGSGYQSELSGQLTGLREAIRILCALPTTSGARNAGQIDPEDTP